MIIHPCINVTFEESVIVSSHERKYLSFKLLELLLPTLDVSEVSMYNVVVLHYYCPQVVAVFTPNLLRCLRNNLSGADNYLNKAAKHLVNSLAVIVLKWQYQCVYVMWDCA